MGIEFFLAGWGLGFTVYVILQALAAFTVRRRRMLVLAPAPLMLGVLLWTIFAYRAESNLWPVVMIFSSPLAAIVVTALWVRLRIMQRRERETA